MLELFILFHAAFLGISYWVTRFLRLQNGGAYGIAYFLSIPLLVCALYLLNAGFSIGLVASSRTVFGVAFLGLVLLFMDRQEIKSLLSHPIFYLLPLVGLFFAFSPEMSYQPTEFDEYAGWLNRPIMMVLDDSILNPARHGYGRGFDYTPGAALLLAFKNLIWGQNFSIGPLIVVPLILCLALLGVAYDCIKQLTPKGFFLPELTLMAGLVTLMSGKLIPVNLLIESFQFNILIAIGLCFFWVANGGGRRRSGLIVLGILCAYAYLVKVATILILPGLVIALILHQVTVWRDEKNEPIKSLFRRLSIETLILVGPAVLIVGHWTWLMRPYGKTFTFWAGGHSLALWEARAHLMPLMWARLGSMVFETPMVTFITLASLAGYLWGLRNKAQRALCLVIFGYCILHFLLIVWLVRTMFGDMEAEALASFNRYMLTGLVPYVFFGILLLSVNLFAFIRWVVGRFNLNYLVVNSYKRILIVAGLSIALPGLAAFGSQYAQKIRAIPFDPIPYKVDILLSYINENNLKHLKVQVIDQGGNTTNFVTIVFYSYRKDVFQRGISFEGGRTLTTKQVLHWDVEESREATKERLSKADVLWVERSDEYVDGILSEITNKSTCELSPKKYFLFKGVDGRFECKTLQFPNPTQANCSTLIKDGKVGSGIYEMDPDGVGPLPKISTRCNMEKPGGWTLVASISDKNRDHINPHSVNKDGFYKEGGFGKLSDEEINRFAFSHEFLLQCGNGEMKEIYIKDHGWRSDESSTTYRGLFSSDQNNWIEFHEKGAALWGGFDNFDATFGGEGKKELFSAYGTDETGCFSQNKRGKGFLWVR